MPPRIQELLQQRNVQIGVAVGVALIIIIGLFMVFSGGGGNKGSNSPVISDAEQLILASVPRDQVGKAIEIQALMARNNLPVERVPGDNNDLSIRLKKGSTEDDKDRGLIALVQSGLVDKNIGLEAFDKGDLTSSREEKRIKLTRAQQGELARLIRKIPPIEDASVSLSIPEATLFRNQQKPMSASVQVTMAPGATLDRDKVRSIINLMTGSVQGLDAQHVALTDTNGTVYNSVLDIGSELNDKLAEQDTYMRQKVASQLDKLVGPGHYVVTVSTLLREAPKEMMTQSFDPDGSVVSSKQTFNENLNANAKQGDAGGPVSSVLPQGIAVATDSERSSKDYDRNGQEVTYENTKVQTYETRMPGMIEDISVAVTIDKTRFPNLPERDLRHLVASAASPKVDPDDVSIAAVDFKSPDLISGAGAEPVKASDSGDGLNWLPWAVGSVVVCLLLIVLFTFVRSSTSREPSNFEYQMTQNELQSLRELASQQQSQIQQTQEQTQALLDNQRKQLESSAQQIQPAQSEELKQTLTQLQQSVQGRNLEDEEDLDLQIKSWIESS
ncbi:MAG: flagellar M-ring protein FliF C-terminal domain-containing protein [Vampirovibrionales bacterium]|nr:flagellar M-ring protein FliF C-terminal domain-containing protein [Vampirovibrionales bacterium]